MPTATLDSTPAAPGRPRPPARRRPRWLVPLVAAVAIALAAIAFMVPPSVTVVAAVPIALRDEAAGTGVVKAKVLVGVGAKINGVVETTLVDQGDAVRKGQVMATLRSVEIGQQIRVASSDAAARLTSVAAARAVVAAAEARWQASSSNLEKARAGLRLAELALARARALHEGGVSSREMFDAADTGREQASRDVDAAESLRAASGQELAAARAAVDAAEHAAEGARAGVRLQEATFDYTVVRSPIDGYVVSRDLEAGATVVPGLPIFTVADPSVVWVTASIDVREVAGLRAGQAAIVALRSDPGASIAARVARVAQQADPVTEEIAVDVAFVRPPPVLRLNETAEVTILKAEKARASAVPATAIVTSPDGPAVWIVRSGRLERQKVSLGLRDKRGLTEILAGVTPDDRLVANPSAAGIVLVAGDRVRARVSTTVLPE